MRTMKRHAASQSAMPGNEGHDPLLAGQNGRDETESQTLLSQPPNEDPGLVVHPEPANPPPISTSAIAQPAPDGQRRTPRTPNRVRFDLDEDSEDGRYSDHHDRVSEDSSWLEQEDYARADLDRSERGDTGPMLPLLTDMEAPSVTLATSEEFFPEDHLESARPRSGMRMAFMNMANSIIGAGIIGQAYAFRQSGMLTGIILLTLLTVAVDWTIRLIVVNSKLSGADSFQATMQHCFGKSGLIAISLAQWAFAYGGMIAFCIIVGDTIPHVFSSLFPSLRDMSYLWLLTDRRAIIVLFVMGISYPLSLYRDIAKLGKASTMALISMVVILVAVITQVFRVPSESRGDVKSLVWLGPGPIQAIGVISFAFVCHHNSLLIYGSLKKPTMDRFAMVTHYSTGVSLIMCLTMSITGFLAFGTNTQGNVLNNFPSDNIMINIARLCFGLNMLTTLPLEAFVCRSVMVTYYYPDAPFNLNRHVIFTTALVLSSMAISLVICDLGAVFELIGATSACALAYIFPPLCYVKLSTGSQKAKIPAFVCIGFGCMVMGVSLVQAIIKMLTEGGSGTCSA